MCRYGTGILLQMNEEDKFTGGKIVDIESEAIWKLLVFSKSKFNLDSLKNMRFAITDNLNKVIFDCVKHLATNMYSQQSNRQQPVLMTDVGLQISEQELCDPMIKLDAHQSKGQHLGCVATTDVRQNERQPAGSVTSMGVLNSQPKPPDRVINTNLQHSVKEQSGLRTNIDMHQNKEHLAYSVTNTVVQKSKRKQLKSVVNSNVHQNNRQESGSIANMEVQQNQGQQSSSVINTNARKKTEKYFFKTRAKTKSEIFV